MPRPSAAATMSAVSMWSMMASRSAAVSPRSGVAPPRPSGGRGNSARAAARQVRRILRAPTHGDPRSGETLGRSAGRRGEDPCRTADVRAGLSARAVDLDTDGSHPRVRAGRPESSRPLAAFRQRHRAKTSRTRRERPRSECPPMHGAASLSARCRPPPSSGRRSARSA